MHLDQLFAARGGIVSTAECAAEGMTAHLVRQAVLTGRAERIRQGSIRALTAPAEAVQAVRVGGFLTCISALRAQGVWCVDDGRLHVRVDRHANHLALPTDRSSPFGDPAAAGVVIHRSYAGDRIRPDQPVDLVIGDRLVLELDGRQWHSTEAAFAEDRRRDLLLHERGCLVIRLTYAQVMFEWPRVEALIRALVGRQEHSWSAGHRQAGPRQTGLRQAGLRQVDLGAQPAQSAALVQTDAPFRPG
ncbi:type IV toxin-antitoxin system AbiEi family antitoxin domain-containing protein [Subtercola vilae]|uniref:DUF559 domain-containing protein n=1 Tax=Subtercola vilae TaxID=2056433 RepID=A0A4T2C1R8_9MICO|nr:type IV toxin-antitoxin system AbiEi family antitoxin domain-containing protein [Subtercola vilae]TIH38253.1 hypothetical protein D4765_06595 [Subtercola vilae]